MLSVAVSLKVCPYLLRDGLGFAEYLGPPPRPWLLRFRLVAWWAAEPDHPPSTLFCSGGPARRLMDGWPAKFQRARGRAERAWRYLAGRS